MKKNKIVNFLSVAVFLIVFTAQPAIALNNDDAVRSRHIAEADGTSGQDTNTGSGIKTDHIQDGAVTDAKISGPVSASKISSVGLDADTVDGKHASDLAPVGHGHTTAEVSGLDEAMAGKADLLHYHDDLYQQKYGKVAVVARAGGDYTDPVSAMSAAGTWCGTPSSSNPCLLKIMPGVYDIGATSFQMQQFIDVEGAGENTTVITGYVDSQSAGVVNGSANAELRQLAIQNTGGGSAAIALYNSADAMKVRHVTLTVSGSAALKRGFYNRGISTVDDLAVIVSGSGNNIGVVNYMSSTVMQNVTISVSGYEAKGLYNNTAGTISIVNATIKTAGDHATGIRHVGGGTAAVRDSEIIVTGPTTWGVFCQDAPMTIANSNVSSEYAGVANQSTQWGQPGDLKIDRSIVKGDVYSLEYEGAPIFVGVSQLDGPAYATTGNIICIGTYDGNYAPVACP